MSKFIKTFIVLVLAVICTVSFCSCKKTEGHIGQYESEDSQIEESVPQEESDSEEESISEEESDSEEESISEEESDSEEESISEEESDSEEESISEEESDSEEESEFLEYKQDFLDTTYTKYLDDFNDNYKVADFGIGFTVHLVKNEDILISCYSAKWLDNDGRFVVRINGVNVADEYATDMSNVDSILSTFNTNVSSTSNRAQLDELFAQLKVDIDAEINNVKKAIYTQLYATAEIVENWTTCDLQTDKAYSDLIRDVLNATSLIELDRLVYTFLAQMETTLQNYLDPDYVTYIYEETFPV